MIDDEASENVSFSHGRVRMLFSVPYCLKLVKLTHHRGFEGKEIDLAEINMTVDEAKHNPSLAQLSARSKGNPLKGGYGAEILFFKPKILDLMENLYLKADKMVADEFLDYLDLFTEFIKSEKDNVDELTTEHRPNVEFIRYLFGSLLHFLKIYVEKLVVGNGDEGRDRRDSQVISELVNTIYNKFASLSIDVSKDEALNLKTLADYYVDETNTAYNQVSEMLDVILQSKDKGPTKHEDQSFRRATVRKSRREVEEIMYNANRNSDLSAPHWDDLIRYVLQSKKLFEVAYRTYSGLNL